MYMKKRTVVLGAGGFIGGHLVTELKNKGHWVRGVDIKRHEYKESDADEFIVADLRDLKSVESVLDDTIDEVYQLAADMGGAAFVFTGENDSEIMHNSALINLNVCDVMTRHGIKKVFYSSSACMYPEYNQMDPDNPKCSEDSAYPAGPDSEYGWEKLFSERLFLAFARNKGLDVKIARFHNIFGPLGTWNGGREKAPAAMLRKVCEAKDGDSIEVWGDGLQTRSFLFVDECVEAVIRLMESDFAGPVNIGSEEMVTINRLAEIAIKLSGKNLTIKNVDVKQIGVRGRNSDNKLIKEKLGWEPNMSLEKGMGITYEWIDKQVFLSRFCKTNKIINVKNPNNGTKCDYIYTYMSTDSVIGNTLNNNEIWELEVRNLLITSLDKNFNGCIVDIGANIGTHTVQLSLQYNHAKVYAFEPQKHHFYCLEKNINDNNISNCSLFRCGLSDGSNEYAYHSKYDLKKKDNYGGKGLFQISDNNDQRFGEIDIHNKCILKKLDDYNLENVGLIKVDVEGHELSILKGSMQTIKNNLPIIFIEIWNIPEHYNRYVNSDSFKILFELGYKLKKIGPMDYILHIE